MSWQELSEAEWRGRGGHRPSAPLAIMFCTAGILAILAAILTFIALRERQTLAPSGPWTRQQLMIITSFMPIMAMMLWGVGSFAAILTRWRHGPRLMSWLTAVWALCAIGAQFANVYFIASGSLFIAYLPLLPSTLFQIALAAGMSGYMLDGYWPNLYFRRRVRTT